MTSKDIEPRQRKESLRPKHTQTLNGKICKFPSCSTGDVVVLEEVLVLVTRYGFDKMGISQLKSSRLYHNGNLRNTRM